MTIKIHSLQYSRAMRVAWLCEELSVPYDVIHYDRTDAYTAPDALKKVHPLGKSPVIEDGDLTLGESAAILRHIHRQHGHGRFTPGPGGHDLALHDEWLDYAEGTLIRPVGAAFWAKKGGTSLDAKTQGQIDLHMGHMDAHLSDREFLMGHAPMLADMQLCYLLAMARFAGVLKGAHVTAYLDRLLQVPALQRALEATGPIMPDG
ncbi:glutathione S-transferase family protein [Maribius pontilimi]|uniref:Glutathione S-transferase family protein n=1 Tax=Palleronia pontilimi TaxID=1964209 RepID=A0A934I9V1_9RHOB|nr:glutathione S-transferase family protein [Palleronia pontilimi]MBJ3761721.1 glutathione S-transferase family protein [Palleronia pontilimi]